MARQNKWEEIANILRNRILSGELKPGQDFPTNMKLMKEFDVYIGTIQQAINALIQEGLVVTFGSGTTKRMVRTLVERSVRQGDFITEYKNRGSQKILDLRIIKGSRELPEPVLEIMKPPVLYFKTLQIRDNIPVAISCSFIPSVFSLEMLLKNLQDPKAELYTFMKSMGFNPTNCQESLVVDRATSKESELFELAPNNNLIVVRINRKVFDETGNLIEFCLLTDRADAYEFVYNFAFDSGT